jgi:heme/copper-type cytochrome/quinol oxidase subunit 2
MPWQGEGELATHGFLIPWYGVARKLEPDAAEPVRVVFTADRPGTYEFQCVVYCGFGHRYQAREMLFVEAAQ